MESGLLANGDCNHCSETKPVKTAALAQNDARMLLKGANVLADLPQSAWETKLVEEGINQITDVKAWLVENTDFAKTWKWEHVTMRMVLQSMKLTSDVRFYFLPAKQSLFAAWSFSREMVGHPSIVHGGATSFAFDETFGLLFASLNLGPGFTANLTIDYRKPFQATLLGCLHATVQKIEGRKVFLEGTLRDKPDGEKYADAKALFIIPRKTQC